MDAFYEIDEGEAEIVREIFDRDTERGESIADIVRALPAKGLLTRTGKHVRDRSTVWAMLRNPAHRGQAEFGKTQTTGQRAKPSHPVAHRGERHGRRETRRHVAPEQWTSIPAPALSPRRPSSSPRRAYGRTGLRQARQQRAPRC